MQIDHRARRGPMYWDWRCLVCSEPVSIHPTLLQHLRTKWWWPGNGESDTTWEDPRVPAKPEVPEKPEDYEWPVGSGKWITHYLNHAGTWQGRDRT